MNLIKKSSNAHNSIPRGGVSSSRLERFISSRSKSSGFTLIELLVVIAIIGILASVILASLNNARSKGADASIKANLSNARAQAELFYDSNGYSYYGGASVNSLCYASANAGGVEGVNKFMVAAQQAFNGTSTVEPTTSDPGTWNMVTCHSSSAAWVMAAPLKNSTAASPSLWCVDSTGFSGTVTTLLTSNKVTCQ